MAIVEAPTLGVGPEEEGRVWGVEGESAHVSAVVLS